MHKTTYFQGYAMQIKLQNIITKHRCDIYTQKMGKVLEGKSEYNMQ